MKCPKDGKECDIRMGNVYEHCRHGLPSVDGNTQSGRVCPIYDEVSVELYDLSNFKIDFTKGEGRLPLIEKMPEGMPEVKK